MSECIQLGNIFPTCSEQLFDLRLVSEVVIFPCLLVYSACAKFCLSCSLIHLVQNYPQGLQHLCCCHNGNTPVRAYACLLSCYVSCPPFFPFPKIWGNGTVSLFQRTKLSLPSLPVVVNFPPPLVPCQFITLNQIPIFLPAIYYSIDNYCMCSFIHFIKYQVTFYDQYTVALPL